MSGGVESLYPFLYRDGSGGGDVTAVLDEVRRGTAEKAAEIVALRQRMAAEYADRLTACAAALAGSFRAGGRLFTFGNGGSSTDAQAVAQLFLDPGQGARALPAIALTTDVAVVTALSNDVGFEVVFARQLAAFARPGDVAMGLSTSGGSANVLRAFDEAAPAGPGDGRVRRLRRRPDGGGGARSSTCSWSRPRRCTGSRRPRRRRTTCCGS